MKPFLYNVAHAFYTRQGEAVKDNTFVFPSRRAQLFFLKYLAEMPKNPIFSPTTLTIDDFISQLSGYAPADRIEMLFLLYKHYKNLSTSNETFDDFLYWADILLSDFDDVDKYLVDASQLFSNIYELKNIDEQFKDILTPEQRKFLERFVSHFNVEKDGGELDNSKKEFINLWKILYNLYTSLHKDLEDKGCAYNGMMLRSIIDDIEKEKTTISDIQTRYKNIVFVGFNILSTAEEKMMKLLQDMGVADFYWDFNTPVCNDVYSMAGEAMRKNMQQFVSKYSLNEDKNLNYPEIEVVAIPSNTGQTKYAGKLLSELIAQKEDEANTVVVLPDENLLMPMLGSLPSSVNSVNVTMGYPLGGSPLASLFSVIYDLQIKSRKSANGEVRFYHRNVTMLLQQPYIQQIHKEIAIPFMSDIREKNMVYIAQKDIPEEMQYLFVSPSDNKEALSYLTSVIEKLNNDIDTDNAERAITKEFLFYYQTVINRLANLIIDEEIQLATLFRLIDKMCASIKVPFNGEPLSGLQIMGVLETRALDFDNVIILSMNEGVFPADSRSDTFIPYNVRRGFGLSSYEQRDGMAEYYFYRLISRAKKVYMTYDTRTEGVKIGDVSRFVYQLKYQYLANSDKLVEKSINYNINSPSEKEIKIEKRGPVLEKLNSFLDKGDKNISASAINTYIDCPLKFYFTYIERIAEPDKVSEDLDASTFGTIYHEVMQHLYLKYEGKEITIEVIDEIAKDEDFISKLIKGAFVNNYFKASSKSSIKIDDVQLEGRLFLRAEIIKKMVYQTLKLDKLRVPFKMLKNELPINAHYTLSNGKNVRIKGLIDRLESKGKYINIIDYKSGKAILEFSSPEKLFTDMSSRRSKAVLQLLFYVLLLKKGIISEFNKPGDNKKLKEFMISSGITMPDYDNVFAPGLYAFENYFAEQFLWRIRYKHDNRIDEVEIGKYSEMFDEYLNNIDNCLISIFDENTPFVQTQDIAVCEYCPFADMCRR
ncbi:MAG: PD-(D/E)XK nuclease family protein [Bacteroidales bacterium]|nr:PD-(D/E)XK nuclease family protein [Bacteroidales bacterium]